MTDEERALFVGAVLSGDIKPHGDGWLVSTKTTRWWCPTAQSVILVIKYDESLAHDIEK